jgi:T4 gene Gp59 loader of gp41 DNA helicase C-term/T4 gene Gp59 loader of gp41 DNA helicase
MKHFSGYGAYLLFLAIRTHFDSVRYDFFQMNGKLTANKQSYEKRQDKSIFVKFAKEYNTTDLRDFYIANILDDRHYIAEFMDDRAKDAYNNYKRRRQSLSYICSNDMGRVFDQGLREPFIVSHRTYPSIVLLFLRGEISLETMVILDDFLGYTTKFDTFYQDDVIWPKISKKISKYRPFLKYDKNKMRDMLKSVMTK